MSEKVIIVGGGLAGLTAAYALKKQGIDALVLEANNRLGGRIYTKRSGNQAFELGATWVFQDPVLKELISELGLDCYPQFLKGDALVKYAPNMTIQRSPTDVLMNGAVYHKVSGGTAAIIQALSEQLEDNRIRLNTKVSEMAFEDDLVSLTIEDGSVLQGAIVMVTVPPKAVVDQIKFSPELAMQQVMRSTHTWMGESSKFTVLLDKDYWRIKKLSGFVFSNYGLIREMQDHSSEDGKSFGLLGFMQPAGRLIRDFQKRKQVVIQELTELFNIEPEHVLGYEDYLWGEHFTDDRNQNFNDNLMPHQNNGHEVYQQGHFDQRLYFAGAECSASNPGYMEGAVKSAYQASKLLLE